MTKGAEKRRVFSDWPDFSREYAIIVLGVLTALLAQQMVETLNWRQKVRSATADMDQEMSTGNGPQAFVRLSIHQCLSDRLGRIRALANGGDRSAVRSAIDAIQLPVRTYDFLAREAALSADIAAHMPTSTMYGYRIVYAPIPELENVHRDELASLRALRSLPETGGPLTQEEKRAVLAAVESLMIDNDRAARASAFTLRWMRNLGIGLDRPQLGRNLDDLPVYRNCHSADIRPLLSYGSEVARLRPNPNRS